jgi:hypothetical protein
MPLRRSAHARQALDLDLSFGSVVSTQTRESDPFSCALSPWRCFWRPLHVAQTETMVSWSAVNLVMDMTRGRGMRSRVPFVPRGEEATVGGDGTL